MSLKTVVLNLYSFAKLSKEETNLNQQFIRNTEWSDIQKYIKIGKFLDVGCGAGYSMRKALEMGCDVSGVDPEPGAHGVGRYDANSTDKLNIVQGFSEALPYADNTFDTVYSSHVLEHVNNVEKSLTEMKRVLKKEGVLIIGMPTNTMAKINLFTQYVFFTHHRIVNAMFRGLVNTGSGSFREIFLPPSHSHSGKSVFFDIQYYKPQKWAAFLQQVFKIDKTIYPIVYPYPESIQYFKPYVSASKGSSVFFICSKKEE